MIALDNCLCLKTKNPSTKTIFVGCIRIFPDETLLPDNWMLLFCAIIKDAGKSCRYKSHKNIMLIFENANATKFMLAVLSVPLEYLEREAMNEGNSGE